MVDRDDTADEPTPVDEAIRPVQVSDDTVPEVSVQVGAKDALGGFVGRVEQIRRLNALYHESRARNELSFVTLVGASGVGKTRLASEFVRNVQLEDPSTRVLHGDTSPRPLGYEAIVRALWQRFGIGGATHSDVARQRIEAAVAEVMQPRLQTEVSHLIAHLLDHGFPDSPVVESLAHVPGRLEVRTYIAVRRLFERDAEQHPLVLYFDGVERARTETVNLIHYLADGLKCCSVMIIACARPTIYRRHPHWGQGDFPCQRLDVEGLAPDEAQRLFADLAGTRQPPPILSQVARERLDGNPRAVGDFARFLHETNVFVLGPTGDYEVDQQALRAAPRPRTHEEIVRARVASLPEDERRVLEKAAIVGEVFWVDAVVALMRTHGSFFSDPDGPTLDVIAAEGDRTRSNVTEMLDSLEERGLFVAVDQSSIAGEREYRFAYPPIWDLAYDAVEHEDKRRGHVLAAQWLELRPEGRRELQQEQVGYHLQRAGDGRGAASRYRRAADAARARYFNHKAIRLYRRALSCMDELDIATRIHIWHDLASVYHLKGDFDRALDAAERMVRLSWLVATRPKAAVAFNKMGRIWRQKGNLELSLEYLQRGLDMFRQCNDRRGIATSLDDIGQVFRLQGRLDDALDRSASALEMRRRAADKRSMAASLSNIGNIEKDRGLFSEAEACYAEALELRQEVGDRYGYVVSLNNLGTLSYERGDLERARDQWEEALAEAERIGALPLQVVVLSNLGETATRLGKLGDARQRLTRARSLALEVDDQRAYIEIVRNLGLVELQEGNWVEARANGDECLGRAKQAQLPEMVGKAYMLLGEVNAATLFDASHSMEIDDTADAYFQRAADVFREMGSEAELARALRRLGEHLIEHGDPVAARRALREAATIFDRLGIPEAQTIRDVIASF